MGEKITQLPPALNLNAAADYLELSQYVGVIGGAPAYVSKKVTPGQISATFVGLVPTGISFFLSGGGLSISNGIYKLASSLPFAATITAAEVLADQTGNISVDVLRCTYAQYDGGVTHPVPGDSITGGNPLVISAGVKVQSSLSGWNVSLNAGDIIAFNVSGATVSNASIILNLSRAIS